MRKKETGFTLIELLIVIAIIGILAAIAIPNLLNALQRGKQKRTMADMRDLAIAIESYNTDNNVYPPATTCTTPAEGTPTVVGSNSFSLLKPTYIAVPPVSDGWKNFLLYSNGATAGQGYTIESFGRNGTSGPSSTCGTTTNFNDDIVYTDGTFVQWPEGPQQ